MGLFSFLGKKNQDSSADVSGRFSRPDDEFAERARAKRASHAGGGARRGADDPVLPEKKRARRRLVGAIALALAAAVGLPMLLDSEPKPLAGDIAIQIPAKDKAAPLPVPAAPGASSAVAASDSVDKGEEVVAAPPAKPAAAAPAGASRAVTEVQATPAKAETPKPAPAPVEHVKPEAAKPEPARVDPAKSEHKDKPARPDAKPEPKDKPKNEDKPAHAAPQDSARAVAILEGKAEARASDAGQKYVLQVIATASQEKAAELQAKLRATGIHSFTEKLHRPQGDLIRVKVGPFSHEEAEKVRSQLSRLGLSGALSPA
jgi:DedD protein